MIFCASLSRNDWVLEQRRRKGMRGTTLSEVPGLFGERRELALAANSGTMINSISFPRTRHQEAEPWRLYASGVGHGAAICGKSLHRKIAREETGGPAGALAVPRLDTYSAH
eukprot:2026177-Pyramimonas_sp.AAC.1